METIPCKHSNGDYGNLGFLCGITLKYCKNPEQCLGFKLPDKEIKRRSKRELKNIRDQIKANDRTCIESVNFDKDWEWDELQALHDLFVGISRDPHSKGWLEACKEAQETLGRTSSSIKWHWEYIFIQDGVEGFDYEREGKVMVEFRKGVNSKDQGIELKDIVGLNPKDMN